MQARALAALLALFAAASSRASDLDYISTTELAVEVARRDEDISRTSARIESLIENESFATKSLEQAKLQADEIEKAVITRVGLLYRLSRNGGSVRYILGSPSAVDTLKRIQILTRLVRQSLEAHRQAGIVVVQAEDKLNEIQNEKKTAGEMLADLMEARQDLVKERDRRQQEAYASAPL